MVRKRGPHTLKLELIRYILRQNPQGLWVRELARLTNMKKSTVSYYINTHMTDEIEDIHNRSHLRLIKLKEEEQTPEYIR